MSGEKRLSAHSMVVIPIALLFIGIGLWAARKTVNELLIAPWKLALAGQGQAPWLVTLLMAVFFLLFLGTPVRMLLSSFRGLRKSQEAMAAEKLRTAAGAPPERPSLTAPYRGRMGGDVVARYRASLASLPFPVIDPKPGRHLPFALTSLSSAARKGNSSNLLMGSIIGTVLLAVLIALLRVGAIFHSLVIAGFLAIPAYLLWPWIRPLFSRALLDPSVETDKDIAVAGEPLKVFVELPGPARITLLTVRLLNTEHVTYSKGSSTVTDTHDVTAVWLCEEQAVEIPKGGKFERTFEATIPADAMHSFASQHNRVEWAVRVEAAIDNWPDVKQSYPFPVLPAG